MLKTNESVQSEPLMSVVAESPQPQPNIEWLTAQEAAEHLRIKTRTLLAWTRQEKSKDMLYLVVSVTCGVFSVLNWMTPFSGEDEPISYAVWVPGPNSRMRGSRMVRKEDAGRQMTRN